MYIQYTIACYTKYVMKPYITYWVLSKAYTITKNHTYFRFYKLLFT